MPCFQFSGNLASKYRCAAAGPDTVCHAVAFVLLGLLELNRGGELNRDSPDHLKAMHPALVPSLPADFARSRIVSFPSMPPIKGF